jgi:hypothetical protein
MKFDRIIQALLPHDDKFFALFDELAKSIVAASEILRTLPSAPENEREAIVKRINDLEQVADAVTHDIYNQLNGTFVTPFDREDIHQLAHALDDILDYIDGSAKRFFLYKVKKNHAIIQRLTEVVYKSSLEVQQGVRSIKNLKNVDEFKKTLHKINQFENDGDALFNQAIAELFENEDNAIELIKTKEVLVSLETATDKCEDVANVLESIMIKNA